MELINQMPWTCKSLDTYCQMTFRKHCTKLHFQQQGKKIFLKWVELNIKETLKHNLNLMSRNNETTQLYVLPSFTCQVSSQLIKHVLTTEFKSVGRMYSIVPAHNKHTRYWATRTDWPITDDVKMMTKTMVEICLRICKNKGRNHPTSYLRKEKVTKGF